MRAGLEAKIRGKAERGREAAEAKEKRDAKDTERPRA